MWLYDQECLPAERGGRKRAEGLQVVGMPSSGNGEMACARGLDLKGYFCGGAGVSVRVHHPEVDVCEVVVRCGNDGGLSGLQALTALYWQELDGGRCTRGAEGHLCVFAFHGLGLQRAGLVGHSEGGGIVLWIDILLPDDTSVDRQADAGLTCVDIHPE